MLKLTMLKLTADARERPDDVVFVDVDVRLRHFADVLDPDARALG